MRIGLIGVGVMGTMHAAGWAQTPATFAGCSAATPEEAQPLAARYNVPVYPDVAGLLDSVDVVDICAPTHLHHDLVLQAAAAGKHIICEKPLALSVADGRDMIAACRRAGVRLFVAHVVRFFPEYAAARAAVAAGQIGAPVVIRLLRSSYQPTRPLGNWFLDAGKSGGLMMDLMIHDFDYARWVAGDVVRVYACNVQSRQPAAPVDHALAILTHRSGALSHIEGSWAYPVPMFRTRLEIAGADGLIECNPTHTNALSAFLHRVEGEAPDVGVPRSPVHENPYTSEIKEFYRALSEQAPARVNAGDGLAAVQIATAAIESARSGKAVTIEPLAEGDV